MLTSPREGRSGEGDIRASPWSERYLYIRRESEADNRQTLIGVLDRLVQSVNGLHLWNASVEHRLLVIVELHSVLFNTEYEYSEETFHNLLGWFSKLNTLGKGELTPGSHIVPMLSDCLMKIMKGSARAFNAYISTVISSDAPLDALFKDSVALLALGNPHSSNFATAGLDRLFRHFLVLDVGGEDACLGVEHSLSIEDAHAALLTIIDCMIRGLQVAMFEDPWWNLSYTWRVLLAQETGKAAERRGRIVELSIELDRVLSLR
jgi:hypothetical protein